ncbi:MAG TPA: dTMP kinase [Candidatus Cybelea sp.]|jgi:dTMP kinase|nr:dTMP kinase [Candidatus Cybelea sp.]
MFVVVEGVEGSGKSTLVGSLADRLRADGYEVTATREPGGTPLGNSIRETFLNREVAIAPLAEAMLVNAARAQHVEEVIRPALAAGRLVICDRFTDSTFAYQGYGRGVDLDVLRRLCDVATGGLEPHLVLVLDVPVDTARERLGKRAQATDRIENESDDFHQRVRGGFLALAANSPYHRVLDGTLPAKRLSEEALAVLRKRLELHVQ